MTIGGVETVDVRHGARVTSSVVFVSDLRRSVDFYRDVFACDATLQARDAALMLADGGHQIYLIAHGRRSPHPSGALGVQYLIWTVDSQEDLEQVRQRLGGWGRRTDSYTSGGVTFVAGRDPDGIRLLVAHPGPDELPRTVLDAHLYA